MQTKKCKNCGIVKPLSEYYLRGNPQRYKSEVAKYSSNCRQCELGSTDKRWQRIASRHRKKGATYTWKQLKDYLGEPEQCYLCGGGLTWENSAIDHVSPGKWDLSNLKWTHFACNSCKWSLELDEFLDLCEKILKHNGR